MSTEIRTDPGFDSWVEEHLRRIDPDVLSYDPACAPEMADLYEVMQDYARKMKLRNTAIALPLLRGLITEVPGILPGQPWEAAGCYRHGLSVCRILVNLRLPVTPEEEDVCLAAALFHVPMETGRLPMGGRELSGQWQLSPEIVSLLQKVTPPGPVNRAEKKAYFERIREDRLALLVKIADRAHILGMLQEMPVRTALEYIRETREYYMPLCIYAREHYEELQGVATLMMEKMRSLMDVTEILATRHQEKETAMLKEILLLQEENARIRRQIERLKAERQAETAGSSNTK